MTTPASEGSWSRHERSEADAAVRAINAERHAKLVATIEMAELITRHARSNGLDVDCGTVLKHIRAFEAWHHGFLATGHLMHKTGVRFMTRNNDTREGE